MTEKSQEKLVPRPTMVIGIDPGVNTGFAVAVDGVLERVECMSAVQAECEVLEIWKRNQALIVSFEDARLRTWFGQKGREALQGAGSIKRDSSRWEEFLTHHGITFRLVAPRANTTKLDAKSFERITGWSGRTNEHARDAACLVFRRRCEVAA